MGWLVAVIIIVLLLAMTGGGWLIYQAQQDRKALQQQVMANAQRDQAERKFDRLIESLRDCESHVESALKELKSAAQAFDKNPSRSTFDALKAASASYVDLCRDGRKQVSELEAFVESADLNNETREDFHKKLRPRAAAIQQTSKIIDAYAAWQGGIQTRTFTVKSNMPWQSSGVTAQRGDMIKAHASGQWRWGTFTAKWVDARGENAGASWRTDQRFGNGALLIRVGGGANHGITAGFTAEQVGEVQFRINDEDVKDNQGELTVDFWVFPAVLP